MSESEVIKELGITEKQFKILYERIQSNNILIPEHLKLERHVNEVESEIDENNQLIHELMGKIPAYFSEASLLALYEDFEKEELLS